MRGRWDPVAGRAVVDEGLVALSLSHASAVYPELEGAEIVASEASGAELCSPDGIPVIDRLPGSTSTYLASHWTAHGFALFPAVVEALQQWLLEGYRPPVLELSAVSRFGVATETSS